MPIFGDLQGPVFSTQSASMGERLFLRLEDDPLHGPESAMPAGTLRAFPVSAALRGHVSHVMLYRETFAEGHEMRERVLPDGAVNPYLLPAALLAAGLDGIEFEAYGHLIDGFWSPATNHRDDEFGGSLDNRLRFTNMVLDAVRAANSGTGHSGIGRLSPAPRGHGRAARVSPRHACA
eukprot:gene40140-54269_t